MFNYFKITNRIGSLLFPGVDRKLWIDLLEYDIFALPEELKKRGFKYQKDLSFLDYIQTPERTCYRKKGDCDDYAMMYFAWAKSRNLDAHMVAMWDLEHAATTILLENEWYTFSNFKITKGSFCEYFKTCNFDILFSNVNTLKAG